MTIAYHNSLPSTTWVGENYYTCGVLAFLVGVAYVPDISQAGTAGRWLVMGAGIPLVLLRTDVHPRLPHWLGLGFLAYAAASWMWAPVVEDWANSAIQLALIAALFCVAYEMRSLRGVWIGAGLALTISTIIGLDQRFGANLIPSLIPPAGLFVNKNLFGEACALVVVALTAERVWWLLPPVALGAFISWSRAGWIAIGVCAVIWLWGRSRLGALVLATAGTTAGLGIYGHEWGYELGIRTQFWLDAWDGLRLWGHGLGQFYTAFQIYGARIYALNLNAWHLHNDALEIIFELGLGSIPIFALAGLCLWQAKLPERLVLVALAVESSVGFPLFSPYTLFLGACAAGYAAGRGSRLRDSVDWSECIAAAWLTCTRKAADYIRYAKCGCGIISTGPRTTLHSGGGGGSVSPASPRRNGDSTD